MNSDRLKICVIDDEEDVRRELVDCINESIDMFVVAEADSVSTGIKAIIDYVPDAVFLDIKLRGGDAFQLLKNLQRKMDQIPPVIINTGYRDFDYAQRSLNDFREEVVMLLKKPFWSKWSEKEDDIVGRILDYKKKNNPLPLIQDRIKVKSDNTTHIIRLKDLISLEVDSENKGKGIVSLKTKDDSFTVYKSLNVFSTELPPHFIRISRYIIVNGEYIDSYNHPEQMLWLRNVKEGKGVGNGYKDKLIEYLDSIG